MKIGGGGGNGVTPSNLKWQEFRVGDLFKIQANPQLNKDSFNFIANAEDKQVYPYFTRTCLNNGIAGWVEYLDEEHKIKGNCLAVGMIGMQFFYMEQDFYTGQFTKSLHPKFEGLNRHTALFMLTCLNKFQKILQGILVRDFEKTLNPLKIVLPVQKEAIAFELIEHFIKALEKQQIEKVKALWDQKLGAYTSVLDQG
ncbi:restriction endonuclease subunit S [Helicobacter cynogastricus]|uniref:restriction endonuclease subunit S n=1 Tax=Helicobacter cynogastricus TaxID=329937 RepID=UPI0022790471|nr:restriction endonuclease subunit S [Helicobacter cynogastricus]